MQCLEGLNHHYPPLCLFVQLCPSVQWELEEFRPQHPLPLYCVQNNGPGQQVLNPLPASPRPRGAKAGAVVPSPGGHCGGCPGIVPCQGMGCWE